MVKPSVEPLLTEEPAWRRAKRVSQDQRELSLKLRRARRILVSISVVDPGLAKAVERLAERLA